MDTNQNLCCLLNQCQAFWCAACRKPICRDCIGNNHQLTVSDVPLSTPMRGHGYHYHDKCFPSDRVRCQDLNCGIRRTVGNKPV